MGNTTCYQPNNKKNKQNPPPLENLSFFAQKGGDDNYFLPLEIIYYSKNIENTMKDVKSQLQEKNINWKPGEFLGQGSYASVIMGFNEETGQIMAVKQVRMIEASKLSNVNNLLKNIKKYEEILSKMENIILKKKYLKYVKNPLNLPIKKLVTSIKYEIDLLSRLQHKNIVSYIGAMTEKKTLNIFLEYIAGGSISSLIRKYGKLNENILRIYTRQILQGLEYLHWNGVVHRDIKGANVLVDTSGVCKLTDFGSSKNIKELCDSHTLIGTANWMAPEVIKQTGGGRYSDIWSVGCTVIEMATGKPPWSEFGNPLSTMFKIANANEPPVLPEDLSSEAIDFLKNCFNIDPKKRMNCYKLLRHTFMTGNVNLYHEVKDNNYLDLRKNKKLLSAIPEREDSLSLFTINKKIMENDEDSNRVLSLTKLENEMAVSVVESDVTNVNNIKRYSCDDNRLSNTNFNASKNNFSQVGLDDSSDFDYYCNEYDAKKLMNYSFKVVHHKCIKIHDQ